MTPRRSRVIYFYWFFTHNPKQKKKRFLSCHLGVAYFLSILHSSSPLPPPSFRLIWCHQFHFASFLSFVCWRASVFYCWHECVRREKNEFFSFINYRYFELLRFFLMKVFLTLQNYEDLSVPLSIITLKMLLKSDKHKNMLLQSSRNYYTH